MFKKTVCCLFLVSSLSSGISFCSLANPTDNKVALAQVNSTQQAKPVNKLVNKSVKNPKLNKVDEQAKQHLMAKIAKLSAFSADFSQKVYDADGKLVQENTGNLAVAKPNLLHWQVTQPNESLIVSDGKALWLFDPFIEQVTVYSLEGAVANTPLLLLASNDHTLWQNYQIKQLTTEQYQINAIDENSQVKSLTLTFSANKPQLKTFVILDATGQLSKIQLSQVKPLHSQALFKFTVPEGVEVDDQR